MVHIICTKNDSIWQISTDIWLRTDKSADGRTDARTTQKYIPLTSSVDNKQAKSNGNIDKKKKENQQFIENQNNWIIETKCLSFETDLMPFTQNVIKKVCLLSTHNVTIITFWTNCTWLTQNEIKNLDYYILRRHSQRKMK